MDDASPLLPGSSLKELGEEQLALLRYYNTLSSAARAEVLMETLSPIKISSEEKTKIWENYLKSNKSEDNTQLEVKLRRQGLNKAALEWNLQLPYRIERYCRENYTHKAEERFLARKESLDSVVYSLLRVDNAYIARELYLRIAGKEAEFGELAAQYSQGSEAKTKGIVGPVPMKQAHPILCEKLRTSRPGELLEPFPIENWWLVVRLERFEAARFGESTAQAMAQEIFQEWLEEAVTCKLNEL